MRGKVVTSSRTDFEDLVDGLVQDCRDVLTVKGAKAETSLYTVFENFLEASITLLHPSSDKYTFVGQANADEAGIPDFRVQAGTELKGWVELKAVFGKDLNNLKGHDAKQMDRFVSGLDNVLYTNGWQWRLYRHGQQVGRDVVLGPSTMFNPDELGYAVNEEGRRELATLLAGFASAPTQQYNTAKDAVRALAIRAKALKLALETTGRDGAGEHLVELESDFRQLLFRNGLPFTWLRFVDSYVQLATFGLLLWRLESSKPVSLNQQVGISEGLHPLLAQCLSILWSPQSRIPILLPLLEELSRTVNNIDPALFQAVDAKKAAQRRRYIPDPIVHAYEPFFEQYDPAARDAAGVFYTPVEVVEQIVDGIEDILVNTLDREDGLLDETAKFLDPATGTGTFLLGLANGVATAAADAGLPVDQMVEEVLTKRSAAFELFPGPYTIAHQRLDVALKSFGIKPEGRLPIYLADTLAAPVAGTLEESGFGIAGGQIKEERQAADLVKTSEDILVIFGNPPYERVSKTNGGGFEDFALALFDNLRDATPLDYRADLKSTKDLFVAFWAWTLWALQPPEHRLDTAQAPKIVPKTCNGIAAFITNRTWISGRSLVGLRSLVRQGAREVWVCDLGGDSRGAAGARKWAGGDANVFNIRTGVAIVWVAFDATYEGAANVYYRRLYGKKSEKLAELHEPFDRDDYELISGTGFDPFLPNRWDNPGLAQSPALSDLFWDEPTTGIQTARDTKTNSPIGTRSEDVFAVVKQRNQPDRTVGSLAEWSRLRQAERAKEWGTAQSTRTKTTVPTPDSLKPERVRQILYRPLDLRWVYDDPKWIDWYRADLHHVYLSERPVWALVTNPRDHGAGPAVIHVNRLMDQHCFNNRGAKGVFCLWQPHDEAALLPDPRTVIKNGMRCAFTTPVYDWLDQIGRTGKVENAYDYALACLSAPNYAESNWRALENDFLRVPLTDDPTVFDRAAAEGAKMRAAWEMTLPRDSAVSWLGASSSPLGKATHGQDRIRFSNGRELVGVSRDVWDFEVSGYRVVQEWFKARTHWTVTIAEAKATLSVITSVRAILDADTALNAVLADAETSAVPFVAADAPPVAEATD